MALIAYRLMDSTDPEERLEDAAFWKALYDEYGDDIVLVPSDEDPPEGVPLFGRGLMFRRDFNPIRRVLAYWRDPAFLENCGREFHVAELEEAVKLVEGLHARGHDAFVKSTKPKHAIFRVPVGVDLLEVMDGMEYSFLDGGPKLMVQRQCEMEFEYRFFCIDGQVVTSSPVAPHLTPIDHPLPKGVAFRRPEDGEGEYAPDIVEALTALAVRVASRMEYPHAAVDCALIDGKPGVIEFNPMQLGTVGLFACDVRALAVASRSLIAEPSPALVL